jgi:diacylglycerol kinase family enzyme
MAGVTVIVNPAAGKGRGARAERDVRRAFAA